MLDKLQALEDRYLDLEAKISDPEVIADQTNWLKATKAHAKLEPIVTAYREYRDMIKARDEAEELLAAGDDEELVEMAKEEMRKCAIANPEDVVDAVVIRTKKAYPAYFGTYSRFGEIRKFLDGIENLYCIGRNGQHRYNNMDHSMLTAMETAEAIKTGKKSRKDIWNVNTEKEYHEEKSGN